MSADIEGLEALSKELELESKRKAIENRLEEGIKLYAKREYEKAIHIFREAESVGHPRGMLNLATAYHEGKGVIKDDSVVTQFFLRIKVLAEEGNAVAQYSLGTMYMKGLGVAKNNTEAVKYFRLAADRGEPRGQCNMGHVYEYGLGVYRNYPEAVRWYQLAANQEFSGAQYNLGIMYFHGRGVTPDYNKAIRLLKEAASNDDTDAKFFLGIIYSYGHGTPPNWSLALEWFKMAAWRGNINAQHNIGAIYYNGGEGVERNLEKAKKRFAMAAKLGNQSSIHILSNMSTIEKSSFVKVDMELGDKLRVISWDSLKENEEVGRGAQGKVFKGRWDFSRKEVAIKKLTRSIFFSDADFRNEAIIMSSLSHPNIVPVYGVVLEPHKCIVMEYLPRGTLEHFIHANTINTSQSYQISLDIAHGLSYLHKENDILHRDLKSANILLDENLTAKLADFGFAKKMQLSSGSPHNASNRGTRAWMAPEIRNQLSPSSYTKASDVYSCGVVFWEILTKKRPYYDVEKRVGRESSLEEKLEICRDEPMEASHMLQHVRNGSESHTLSELVKECLEDDPSKRPKIETVCKRLTSFFSPPRVSTPSRKVETEKKGEVSPSPSYRYCKGDSEIL